MRDTGLALRALEDGALAESPEFSRWFDANPTLGDEVMGYVARCALREGDTLTFRASDGASFSWVGALGVAPEWRAVPPSLRDQELVSACLMAHVNESGHHVAISVRGLVPSLVASTTNAEAWSYLYREGAFYGNLFASEPSMHVCSGNGFFQSLLYGPSGRVCTVPGNCGFLWDGNCADVCAHEDVATSDVPTTGYRVYSRCNGFDNVLTTYL